MSASVANQNLEAAKVLGRIVNVGRLGGMTGAFNFDLHAAKRIDYIGVTFRTRSQEEVREVVRLMREDLWPALEAGKLTMPIDKTFPLADIADGARDDAGQSALRKDRHRDVTLFEKRLRGGCEFSSFGPHPEEPAPKSGEPDFGCASSG